MGSLYLHPAPPPRGSLWAASGPDARTYLGTHVLMSDKKTRLTVPEYTQETKKPMNTLIMLEAFRKN